MRFLGSWSWKTKNDKFSKKLEKIASFYQTIGKIVILKSWKLIPGQSKLFSTYQCLPFSTYQTLKEAFWPLGLEKLEKYNKCLKNRKSKCCQKNDKIGDAKILKIPLHLKTKQKPILEEVYWLLRQEKPKMTKNQKKNLKKIAKTCDIKKLKTIPRSIKTFQ